MFDDDDCDCDSMAVGSIGKKSNQKKKLINMESIEFMQAEEMIIKNEKKTKLKIQIE